MSRIFARIAARLGALMLIAPTLQAQRSWPIEVQALATSSDLRQNVGRTAAQVNSLAQRVRGYEAAVLGPTSSLGLYARYSAGPVSSTDSRQLVEGRLLLGDSNFRLEVGYAERRLAVLDSTVQYIRAGFTSTTTLGTSGVAIRLRAIGGSALKRGKVPIERALGWEGETNVSYTWPRFPVFAQLGYRFEAVRNPAGNEEISSVVLGLGLWLKP